MAMRHPNRPRWLIPATIALAYFALEPFNFAIPFLRIVDDVFLVPLLLRVLAKFAVPVTRGHIDPRSRGRGGASVQKARSPDATPPPRNPRIFWVSSIPAQPITSPSSRSKRGGPPGM